MTQTLAQAAYQLMLWEVSRAEATAQLAEQFGVSEAAANAAFTEAQNQFLQATLERTHPMTTVIFGIIWLAAFGAATYWEYNSRSRAPCAPTRGTAG